MKQFFNLYSFLFLLLSCSSEDFEYNERVERFTVLVNTEILNNSIKLEEDKGVLILPMSYSDSGQPVKLVIYCHGGGGSVYSDRSQAEGNGICNYLISLGYAVMDMAGMPEEFSHRLKIDHYRVLGNPIAIDSYEKGYNYVIENYNIDKTGCYLVGNSNGGLTSCNLVNLTDIPFVAQVGLAPVLSIEKNAWEIYTEALSGGEFTSKQNRANIIRLFGMKPIKTQEDVDRATYEKDRVGKYDPYDYCVNNVERKYKIPFKIWHAENDHAAYYRISKEFVDIMSKRGALVELRTFQTGGHAIESCGDIVGKYIYMNKEYESNEVMTEVVEWFYKNGGLPY